MGRLPNISGPTVDLPPMDTKEKKFSGRARLYIGNLTSDVTEDEIKQLFAPYGETSELFINAEKMFAFIRLVSRFQIYAFFHFWIIDMMNELPSDLHDVTFAALILLKFVYEITSVEC